MTGHTFYPWLVTLGLDLHPLSCGIKIFVCPSQEECRFMWMSEKKDIFLWTSTTFRLVNGFTLAEGTLHQYGEDFIANHVPKSVLQNGPNQVLNLLIIPYDRFISQRVCGIESIIK